jgi:hypothetical protein
MKISKKIFNAFIKFNYPRIKERMKNSEQPKTMTIKKQKPKKIEKPKKMEEKENLIKIDKVRQKLSDEKKKNLNDIEEILNRLKRRV